ncbi:SDR family NAD(P)-dependent oxidoreductase [Lentisphaera marina]|uniref:SDR family NAD(P)-dependent oxidoreductase n=1 Tax=Lentisphaera marina TaxID=1111041 RepID=UPI002366ACD8|nr:SDR family NAD(P)-dependent oxidoreductase [Lentisphaera marina]MDD7986051.1 SDR family NAD(P)-dependent oxidoreductase [Lentisphaera marina]
MSDNILIAGSRSEIAKALISKFEVEGFSVWTMSRAHQQRDQHFVVDLFDESQNENFVQELSKMNLNLSGIINCCGILHNENNMPEKQVGDIDLAWLQESLRVNLFTHIQLAKLIDTQISGNRFFWVSLSAMVGSINDNHLGGWYSYRMSKSALNMFVKGLSIEWKRKNRENCVIALHPGTTDSPMSKPFKVRPDKLYSAEQSAERIYNVIANLDTEQNGSFLNWNGDTIPW